MPEANEKTAAHEQQQRKTSGNPGKSFIEQLLERTKLDSSSSDEWEDTSSSSSVTTTSKEGRPKDWYKTYALNSKAKVLFWEPDTSDGEADGNLDVIEGQLRILYQVRDGAAKNHTSLIEASPWPRWIPGALFTAQVTVLLYEKRGEGSLSHYQRHVLQTARRALHEFTEAKRSEEKKSGMGVDVWGTHSGLDDVFIPYGVDDDMILEEFGTLFNKTPTTPWTREDIERERAASAQASSSKQR